MSEKIIAIIPARGGSKSVPRKNIKLLAGDPLIAYSILEAKRSRYIERVMVSTEDQEIADIAQSYGAEVPFLRPEELADDHALDIDVFQHCLRWLAEHEDNRPEIVVHLRPTAPLRLAEHIDKAVELLMAHPEASCARTVCPAPQHPLKMWRMDEGQLHSFIPETVYGIREPYNSPRQSLPAAYVQNGSVDAIRSSVILEENSMSGNMIVGVVMDESESINIDSPIDFMIAEALMEQRGDRKENR